MPNYRRAFVPGGCWFFAVNLEDRRKRLLVEHIDALRKAVVATQSRFPFSNDAMVILPDHLHAVWTLPDGDTDFAVRWNRVKTQFSRAIPKGEPISASRRRRGERGIWQRRYWEHLIRDERDFSHHIDYCWFNPVKHGYVESPELWPYSSFHRDAAGYEPPDFSEFEAAAAEHARRTRDASYGER